MLQIGASPPPAAPESPRCLCPGVPLKRKVAEFRVTPDALLPVGHELRASHFVAGQFVDVSGTSIGKGFQVGAILWSRADGRAVGRGAAAGYFYAQLLLLLAAAAPAMLWAATCCA